MDTHHRHSSRAFQRRLHQACGAFEVSGLEDPRARVTQTQLAGLDAVDFSLGKSRIERSAQSARSDHDAYYFLVRQVAGEAVMEQGRGLSLKPGDFFLASSRLPSTFGYSGPARQLSLHLPHDRVQQLLGREIAGGVRLPRQGVGARSLSRALARPNAARDLPDLLAVLLHEGAAPELGLVDAACRLTELRAQDPGFTPTQLAELLGVQLRRLQRALAKQKLSASGIILDARLRRVSHLLQSASGKTVLACATEAGFSDISGFNRVFLRECGMTPGAFRRQKCRDSPRRALI